jgi:Xaa-Pro aminopeptidase
MIEQLEYASRIRRLAGEMQTNNIDAVLLTGESNIDYFSGFRHHAPWTLFSRPFFEIISSDGRAALLTHQFLEPEARRTSAVEDVRSYAQSGGAPIGEIRALLKDLGMKGGRLGMELGNEQRLGISIEDFYQIEQLPGLRIADVSQSIWKLRMIKSAAEIDLLTKSSEITAQALQACFESARPGMTEEEVGRIAAERMMHFGADRPGFVLMTSGTGNYGVLSGKPTKRILGKNEMLWIDMGAVYKGYWSDFCRAAYFGPPSAELDRQQQIINDVNRAAIEAATVGHTLRDVASAALDAFHKRGINVNLGAGRIGHGIGLMSTEPPHVALYDMTPCEEGLVFTIEPRFVTDYGVFNCEELVVVTLKGPRVLTSSPRYIRYNLN